MCKKFGRFVLSNGWWITLSWGVAIGDIKTNLGSKRPNQKILKWGCYIKIAD